MKKYRQPQTTGFSTRGYTEGDIRVGAFDPDNPRKNPSETLTITFVSNKKKYHILIHSPEGVDEMIKLLADAKQQALLPELLIFCRPKSKQNAKNTAAVALGSANSLTRRSLKS